MEWKQFRIGFFRFPYKKNKILFLKKNPFFLYKKKNKKPRRFFFKPGFFSALLKIQFY